MFNASYILRWTRNSWLKQWICRPIDERSAGVLRVTAQYGYAQLFRWPGTLRHPGADGIRRNQRLTAWDELSGCIEANISR